MDGIQLLGRYGHERVTPDEEQLKRALRMKGPIAVMFSVTPEFFSYRDGVYRGSQSCQVGGINHAMLVIGFGTDDQGVDFWLVQNSWGSQWGINGFVKILRGQNTCGIASCASYPTNFTDPWRDPHRPFSRKLHDLSTGARCLDGSPAGVYFSKGYGDGANKTIIHF